MAVNTNGPCTEYAYGAWDGSPSYSPARYDSPTNEIAYPNSGPYYEQLARTRNTSNASFYGATSVPKSPGSSGSSVAYMSQWGQNAYGAPYQPFNASSGSESSFSNTGGIYNGFVEQEFVPDMGSRSRLISAQDRDLLEQDHLILPTAPNAAAYDLHFEPAVSEGERLLSAYWTCIHPLFPIIHKPSFQLQATSPLLRAAMWALGAQALQTHEHVSKSRVIHEQCMKVLKKVGIIYNIRSGSLTDKFLNSEHSTTQTHIASATCKPSYLLRCIRSSSHDVHPFSFRWISKASTVFLPATQRPLAGMLQSIHRYTRKNHPPVVSWIF